MFLSLTHKLFCRMANIQKELPNSGNDRHPQISKWFHICFIKILCKWPDNYLSFVAFIIKARPFGLHTSYHICNFFFFLLFLECLVFSKRDQELGNNGSWNKKTATRKTTQWRLYPSFSWLKTSLKGASISLGRSSKQQLEKPVLLKAFGLRMNRGDC